MSREHFHESQIEDKVDGQVNLVEDQALKIHEEQTEIQKKLRQGCYPSEIVLAMVVEYLQEHYNNEDEIRSTRQFCRKLLTKINDDTLEVNNA